MRRSVVVVTIALSLLVAACSSDTSATDTTEPNTTEPDATTVQPVFPDAEWARVAPADVGLDPARVQELDTFVRDQPSNCMAIVKDGQLVHDAYWNDFTAERDQEIFSATKSITSTLVGIAQDEGALDINEAASTYITEWQGTPSADVTIRDLLANVSGRYWSLASDYGDMIRSPDKTGYSIGLTQQFPPGENWEYNNSAIQTLDAVISRATGVDTLEFARTRLFEPLGMSSTISQDQAGNTLTFMGAQASCLDLARFGYLLLQQGRWGDEQVVSAEWVTDATTPATELNAAYGYLTWLNRPGKIELPNVPNQLDGPLWTDAPPDAFAALGLGGQTVLVIPSEGLVVTRIATAQGGVRGQGNLANEIARLLTS